MPKKQIVNKNFRPKTKTGRRPPRALPPQSTAVIVIERRYHVIEMKRDGWTNREISQKLGISEAMVSEDIEAVLSQTIDDTSLSVDQERQLQIEQLDQLIKTFTPYATQPYERVVMDRVTKMERTILVPPDPEYARLILSITERKAKLLGLDKKGDGLSELATAIREYRGVQVDKV